MRVSRVTRVNVAFLVILAKRGRIVRVDFVSIPQEVASVLTAAQEIARRGLSVSLHRSEEMIPCSARLIATMSVSGVSEMMTVMIPKTSV
jgi:hypothetical protein